MGRTAVVSFAVLAAGLAPAPSSAADLEQGIALYWSGQYAETIAVLTLAQRNELRDDERVECLKYLAFSHVAMGDNERARGAFAELLAADPRHVLDPSLVSPKIVHQFELSRTELVESMFRDGKTSYFDEDYAATRETMARILAIDAGHALAREYLQLTSEQESLIEKAASLAKPVPPPPKEVTPPAPEEGRVYRLTGQIAPPVLISTVKPEYPPLARRMKREGKVVVTIVVGADGSVTDAKIVRPVSPELDRAALDAVRRWRYRPARMNGHSVAVYSVVNLEFRLD